jgi:transcriptional regulator with XRE-family HTH domain
MENFQLAQRIRAFRKLKGYTQHELADLLNMSVAVIGSIERGTRTPDEKLLRSIAEGLGIELSELVPPSDSNAAERGVSYDVNDRKHSNEE